jgi:beta-glucosidase/6-phospho-beta-glucosidase/beta-galactosidase
MLAATLAACGSDGAKSTGSASPDAAPPDAAPPDAAPPAADFPPGFLFGTAIAGFQSDMGCPTLSADECVDRLSDWYRFTTAPETVGDPQAHLSGQDPAVVGPGFWELYDADVARAADELHGNALRFSIEWSRVFPTATDGVEGYDALKAVADPRALAKYHALLDALHRRGMQALVTLEHYTLPTWIHDPVACHTDFAHCSPRGWVDAERTVREAAKYAGFVAREFGGEVDLWATLNEPLQNMLFGYLLPSENRSHPPAVYLQIQAARTVLDALIQAHARMYDAIKANDTVDADGDGQPSMVGIVYPMVPIEPKDPASELDRQGAENVSYLWNRAFLNAVARGDYDEHLDGHAVHRDDLAGRMDYIGINWYFSITVQGSRTSLLPAFSPLLTIRPTDFAFGDNRPEALRDMLRYVNEDLHLPVIISENGAPDPNDDGTAPAYLLANLRALRDAIADGADVRGYFWWTLTDNYEWNHGMGIRMGLYAVDPADPMKRRVARRAVAVYGDIAASRRLP